MRKNFKQIIHIISEEISGPSNTIALVNIDGVFDSFFVNLIRFLRF